MPCFGACAVPATPAVVMVLLVGVIVSALPLATAWVYTRSHGALLDDNTFASVMVSCAGQPGPRQASITIGRITGLRRYFLNVQRLTVR
ncbi:MAG: hypothetical protein QG597_333 [Actinomycetota bacterium]|nr:hypothetical protein [Actinomycetota bacterium]